jgi:hypothetical protein
MVLRALLPEHHLSSESKDVVKVSMGLIGTITALVLGLLIASAKSSFDTQRNGIAQLSANVMLLDRALAHYGPEAKDCREHLKRSVTAMIAGLWPASHQGGGKGEPTTASESLYEELQALKPQTDSQRAVQAQAIKTATDVAQARWLLSAEKGSAIPLPFLAVLVFWLALLFASFSMFSRPNITVVAALLFCALSAAGAIYLILEMDRPFDGLIQLSSDPLERVLAQMGR